jgi:enoyl-CoA hydratase/carnithine racemase
MGLLLSRVSVADVIDLAAYGDLLAGVSGPAGQIGPWGEAPIIVVDLESSAGDIDVDQAAAAPFVTVGVSRSDVDAAVDAGSFAGFDVLLLETESEVAAPWVVVADLEEAVADVVLSVSRSPLAALLLAQVLRTSADVSFGDALVIESLAYSTLQAGPEFARWLAERPATPPRPREDRVLELRRVDDALEIVLDRPHVHNALNAALRDALCEALAVAAVDDTIQSVRLAGRGPSFCSGGDLDEFGTAPDPVRAHLVRTARSVAAAVAPVAAHTTAHIHGACIGAGIEIAAATGHVVAAPDSRIRLPEVAMGLVPGAGGTASLPRRIGRQRTAWLALTGCWLDVATALRWGLVDEIASGDERRGAPSQDQRYSVR